MTKQISKILLWIAGTGCVLALTGCRYEHGEQQNAVAMGYPQYPLTNQLAKLHGSVKFEVPATRLQIESHPHQQWFFNGFPIDSNAALALGVTDFDTSTLSIPDVSLINCGFYTYQNDNDPQSDTNPLSREFSETAQLLILQEVKVEHAEEAAISGPPICVVSGTPIAGGGGAGKCPGKYVGYVEYQNPNDPSHAWYLTNSNKAPGKAYDAHPTYGNTEVYYIGAPSTNCGCGTNIPASKYPYHFRIYFKTAPIPSGAYDLTLVGFNLLPSAAAF